MSLPHSWRSFRLLLTANGLSALGTQITAITLPLFAARHLGATASEVGVLGSLQWLPYLLFGVVAGVFVDRWPPIRSMVSADAMRALLLGIIIALPTISGERNLVALTGVLLFLFGVGHVFSGIAGRTLLPRLVERGDLVAANQQLSASDSVARVLGPSVGGVAMGLLGESWALALDAATFVISALLLGALSMATRGFRSTQTPVAAIPLRSSGFTTELQQGFRLVFADRALRSTITVVAVSNLGTGVLFLSGVHSLYWVEQRALGESTFGIGFGIGSLGLVVGVVLAKRLSARFGIGRLAAWSLVVFGFGYFLWAVLPPSLLSLTLGHFIGALGFGLGGVCFGSIVHLLTPPEVVGRVTGVSRTATWGVLPLGAVLGGVVAEAGGGAVAILLAASLMVAAGLWALGSPLSRVAEETST